MRYYKELKLHLEKKLGCIVTFPVNRFYGSIYMTTFHHLLMAGCEKELVLVTATDEQLVGEIDVVLAGTRHDLITDGHEKPKVY